ncbi:hypothetical protein M3I54_33720 [Paraburkholderia sp. CNPSo 3274]|uniref:hypothetical protein n=1 Tax=Paraburkholderia sp. CNPSo 3274 TaxID=2940932 RepID=UPI0020B8F578|nr:hypothetical protein [Paraburkholderia sp. CNPSo 3274]MCP3711854.1 hypothetical protein [Paraburkholderia sp. CNPSo 3274]
MRVLVSGQADTAWVDDEAVDLASRGITVNNIQPGPTITDMTAGHIEAIKPLIPLKRAWWRAIRASCVAAHDR